MEITATLRQDVRFALRTLKNSPGFAATAILTMALGVGANSAIFTVVDAVLLRPLPAAHPEELVEIYTDEDNGLPVSSSYPDFLEFRRQQALFAGVAAYKPTVVNFGEGTGAHLVWGELVSANYFSLLGLAPERGRSFRPEDDRLGAEPSVVVSWGFWHRQLGGDPAVVGRTLDLNGHRVPIVGVADRRFKGAYPGLSADLWMPLVTERAVMPQGSDSLTDRGSRSLFVKARLRPGVDARRAQAGIGVLARQLAAAYPETNQRGMTVIPAKDVRLHPAVDRSLVPVATLLMAVPALVLLIACSNVANLLLARASSRGREIAVRLAVGAGRGRLVRQLLTESTLLALAGGGAGLLVAYGAVRAIVTFRPPIPIPIALDLRLDPRVLLFTLTLSLLTGIVFGLAPALQLSRPDLVPALKSSEFELGGKRRLFALRNVLVVAQVAVSLVLLVGAGLFVRSLERAQAIDTGFESEKALIVTPGLMFVEGTPEKIRDVYRRLAERLAGLPGVEAVALAGRLPLGSQVRVSSFHPEGSAVADKDAPEVDTTVVDAAYFPTLGIPLVAGRGFGPADSRTAPRVAIVSQAAARRFWPGRDPLGQRFRLAKGPGPFTTVVGIARDTKVRMLGEAARPYIYLAASQEDEVVLSLVMRTAGAPGALVPAVRRELLAFDADLPILELKTMRQHLALMLYPPRAGAAVLGAAGLLALLLAAMGLYGVVAYRVARRTREIGIRVALGARRGDVLALVVRQGMGLVAVGLVLGLGLAIVATRPLASFLYGLGTADPATFVSLSAVLLLTAFVASWLPARRALRVEPTVALRQT